MAELTVTLLTDRELDAFIADREARQLSPRTIRTYRYEIGIFLAWLRESQASAVTPELIRSWLLRLSEKRNPGGLHANYRAVRVFLRWMWDEYELPGRNPITRVSAPKLPKEVLPPLPLDDLRAMLATCERHTFLGDRDRAMLMTLLDTGARVSEFLALDVGDVDTKSGQVIIRHGKGDKRRATFIGAKARREVLRYLRYRSDSELMEADPLWVSDEGDRLSMGGLRGVVRRRAQAAGVPVWGFHAFRRAFAILSLRSGISIYELRDLMGHSDLTVLQRYLSLTDEDLKNAHRKHGPVDHAL